MIWYNATDGRGEKEIILYDEWDIPIHERVEFYTAKVKDEGKYVRFTDGSNIYTKIIKVRPRFIVTEAGMFRRADIVHCCVPKRNNRNIYSMDTGLVHPAIRPYTAIENKIATKIIQGDKTVYNITPRIKMLTLEKLKARAEVRGMDESEIIDKIVDNAKNDKSIHWRWSMTLLMHAHGMDPNDYIFSHMKEVETQQVQRITMIDDKTKLTETIKIPNKRSIDKMITASAGKTE